MKLIRYNSIAELLQHADLWDDLWLRSNITMPTNRAAIVALTAEYTAPKDTFTALAVEDNGVLLAALPLAGGPGIRTVGHGRERK